MTAELVARDCGSSTSTDAVAQHYDSIFEFEARRLLAHSPIEFAITKRTIERWIPRGSVVADVGIGVGNYSAFLADRHCLLHLVDISQRFLNATRGRLRDVGREPQILSERKASAVDLRHIPEQSCDAVLLLGPLYHLMECRERQAAVAEATRILKPGGVLMAAGINRLAYFRDLIRQDPERAAARGEAHRRFLASGTLDAAHAPMIGFAHLTTISEFLDLFADHFAQLVFVGVESFAGAWQEVLNELSADAAEAWLELVEETASTPEGCGASDHFLFVGKRLAGIPPR